jgi:hypothetical protein
MLHVAHSDCWCFLCAHFSKDLFSNKYGEIGPFYAKQKNGVLKSKSPHPQLHQATNAAPA